MKNTNTFILIIAVFLLLVGSWCILQESTAPKEPTILEGIVTKIYMHHTIIGSDPYLVLNGSQYFYIWEDDFERISVGDKIRISFSAKLPTHYRGGLKIEILERGS